MRASSVLSIAASIILATGLCAFAAEYPSPKVEYSGDNTIEAEGHSMKMKVFAAKEKQRIEMNDPKMGMNTILIMRFDKKVGWNLMPDQKMYNEVNFEDMRKNSGDMRECSYDYKEAGSESVNGVSASKAHATVKCPDGDYEGDFWFTADSIGVKMEMKGKTKDGKSVAMKQEMSNLKVGKLDPSLFEIPSGYTFMGNVNDMMKDAQRQMDEAKKEQDRAMEEARRNEEERKKRAAEEEEKRKQEQAAREYSEKKRKQAETPSVQDAVKGGLQKLFKW